MLRCIGVVTAVLCCGLFVASQANAASKKTEKADAARETVAKVLRSEVLSEVDRRRQLADALTQDPDSDLLRWQSGFLHEGKSWRSFDQSLSDAEQARLALYRERRDRSLQTAASQLEMANWCRQHGFPEQERVHLCAIVNLTSEENQTAAFERLGYVHAGNQWMSEKQLREWADASRRAVASLKRWGAKLEKIAERLDGMPRQREVALAELAELNVPEAIPAIEHVLCGRCESAALAAVKAFARWNEFEATLALAKQAVFSKWPDVREQAGMALKLRPFEDFVPNLIGLLGTPVRAGYAGLRFAAQQGQGLTMLYSYVIARETGDQFQIVVLNTVDYRLNELFPNDKGTLHYNRRARTFTLNGLKQTAPRVENDLERAKAEEAYQNEKLLNAINQRSEELNGRIVETLALVSGQNATSDARAWWSWWGEFTETERTRAKQIVRVDENAIRGDPTHVPDLVFTIGSCFAAGTPVWTDNGVLAIEQIKAGDRVLAKDVVIGELAYKPVLYNSVRTPRELVRVRYGAQSITATGGHRFWVSGDGWTKARDLKPGAFVHTVTGNHVVSSVEPGPVEQTFNLVVDDFHTYFVGNAGLLVQDLPMPRSTNNVVPGLSRRQLVAGANP